MSHELRTPMNAVVGTGVLLRQTELTPPQQGYVDKLEIAAKHMLGLLNNVLDLSQIEQRQIVLEQIPFDLAQIVDRSPRLTPFRPDRNGPQSGDATSRWTRSDGFASPVRTACCGADHDRPGDAPPPSAICQPQDG
jgi:hypothetical protein